MKRFILSVLPIMLALGLNFALTTDGNAQLKFSQLPFSSAVDTGSYCVGVQNISGVFNNRRFRMPNLTNVLSAGNTSNYSLRIHTATTDLVIDSAYYGFVVKSGTRVMAGIRSANGYNSALDLGTSSYTVSVVADTNFLTGNRIVNLPNSTGTLALTSQLPVLRTRTFSGTGAVDSFSFAAPSAGTIVQCQSTNNVAQVKFSYMTGSNIVVKFTSSPASGSNNVSISYWYQ